MTKPQLVNYSTLTFDVYGTLIDWESGMIEGLRPLTSQLENSPGRNEILEAHARHESFNQAYTPAKRYQELLAVVYRRLAEQWGLTTTREECLAYGNSVKNWPAFADSAESLKYLKQHYKLVVLSNIDNHSFTHSNQKLDTHFDFVFTAEDIGSYKPSSRNFDYMVESLSRAGIDKSEILHTAESMFHDHKPANQYELANCWIYRRHDQEGFGATMNPGDLATFDFKFNSMADLVEAHKKELNG